MADINIAIAIATKKATQELQKLEKEFKGLGAEAQKAGKKTSAGLSLISSAAAGAAVAVTAIGAAAVAAINQASKFQDLETQFIAFTGSAAAAAEQVERIAEFSGQTPFQVDELAKANKTLLAFGSNTEQSFVQLKQLGEVAAATGQNIGELSQIFGQIQVAGKLTGERFNQLAERTVNLGPVLAKSLGVAESSIKGLISAGKISSEEVAKAFATMTTGSGQFAGGMERLSKTFSGATSTLKDNIDLLAADLGKVLLPAATDVTVALTTGVQAIRAWFNETKPEQLRKMTGELGDLKSELEEVESGTKSITQSMLEFVGVSEGIKDPEKRARELREEIEKLEKSIVDVSTASQAPSESEAKAEKAEEEPEANAAAVQQAKINDELQVLNAQKLANTKATAATENQLVLEQLDSQRDIILQKEAEKNIALLESKGLFDEAALLQAQTQADMMVELKARQAEQEKAVAEKARKDELSLSKINADARLKFENSTWKQRAQAVNVGLSAISSLQSSGNKQAFEIGKAASIAQALVAIPTTAIEAYKSLAGIPIAGPALGAAAAAAAVVAGTARVNQIRSTKITGFADGGLVQGGIPGLDSVPALLTPGEVVVPERSFKDLKMSDGEVVSILGSIQQSIESLLAIKISASDEAAQSEPLSVELTIDGEVLASRILELNQDNARIA